jgi:hypothetical protein
VIVIAFPRRCNEDRVLRLMLAFWVNSGTVNGRAPTLLLVPKTSTANLAKRWPLRRRRYRSLPGLLSAK